AAGTLSEMASRPALSANSFAAAGRPGDCRRVPRTPGGGVEPGRRSSVGPLARSARPRPARGRQRVLHGLSAPAASDVRPPLAAGPLELAAAAAQQVAGGAAARRIPLGLRSAGPVGSAVVDGVP